MPEKHILLLENEKGLERILTLLLKQANFKVTSCHTIATALAAIAAQSKVDQTDLLIIDIPESNCEGGRLLRQLQEGGIMLPLHCNHPIRQRGPNRRPRKHRHPCTSPLHPL